MIYGEAQVVSLPDLSGHDRLRRISLGQLRKLTDWSGLTHTPALEELYVSGKFAIDDQAVGALAAHPTLRCFEWEGMDAPLKRRAAVVEAIGRPSCGPIRIATVRANAE